MQPKLAFGPMSTHAVEAVFSYSNKNNTPMMLIPSRSQVDKLGGYVNGWNTKSFSSHCAQLRGTYGNARVSLCRDHCGPGFNGSTDIDSVYETIADDIENDFSLIHIDFSKLKASPEKILAETVKAVNFTKSLSSKVEVEIGTDENSGEAENDIQRVDFYAGFFSHYCEPSFYVVNTGSLVMEDRQVGKFDAEMVVALKEVVTGRHGIKLKEHNADYLTSVQISLRSGVVDAMNIAPQLGVVQTNITLTAADRYGIDVSDFLNASHASGKWGKWMLDSSDRLKNSIVSGHYVFAGDEYQRLLDRIRKLHDVDFEIINSIDQVISIYDSHFVVN